MATLLYIILAALLSCANNLNITLKDVSYKDYTTSCTNDPIGDFDLVEVTFLVDYSKEPYVNYVIFQRKRTSETRFIFLTGCNIKENCDGSQNAYGRQIGKDHTEITIRINAKSVLSGAKLRGLVYTPENMAITSSEIIFPNITEFTDVEGKLIVNGKTMTPSTDYREVITQPELNLVFLCESQVSPCLIEISTNDSNETSQGAGNATWTKKYPSQSEVHVMIKYGLCNLFGNSKSISCKFHIEYKSTSNENASSNNAIVWTVCISMTMTLLCV
ncbi:unnamed protein product [Lymnaea stagnalis]|uniref:Uncharacterized protein n=1 Tax=Lymnaea stagnalis TaxID=6523 RepID=A0AAV2HNM5_LYMST